MGCVYSFLCVPTQKRYIGKTTRTLAARLVQHRYHAKTSRLPLYNAVRKYGWDSFLITELYTDSDEQRLFQKEIEAIASYHTIFPTGYNMTAGGEGPSNPQWPPSWYVKNKIRALKMGKAVYCLETDKVYVTIAEAARVEGVASMTVSGICRSTHHRSAGFHYCFADDSEPDRLRALAKSGELYNSPPTTHFGTKNGASRSVLCVETGVVYNTVKLAAEAVHAKSFTSIVHCCRGASKTAYKYHWKYADTISSPIAENS